MIIFDKLTEIIPAEYGIFEGEPGQSSSSIIFYSKKPENDYKKLVALIKKELPREYRK